MANKHFFRTFKSDHIKGGAIQMEYCVEYWQNEILGICLCKEFYDEENYDWANDFVEAGTPWVITRQEMNENGVWDKYKAVAFKSFRQAIEYLILYQEEMSKDPSFLPRGIYIEY